MALFLVDALCTSDRPDQLVLTFNEAVLQVDASLTNDALHLANYGLTDNLTVLAVRIFSVAPYGSRAVLLTVDPLVLGLDRYSIDVHDVEATNGDVIIGDTQHLSAEGIIGGALGEPTLTHAAPSYDAEVLADSPIQYLKLNDLSGIVAANLGTLGAPANGTYTAPYVQGQTGPDGNPSAVRVSGGGKVDFDSTTFPAIGDFSVEAWINPDVSQNGYAAVWGLFSTCGLFLHAGAFEFYESGAQLDAGAWAAGVWQHVVLTRAGTVGKIYVNGALVGTGTVSAANLNAHYNIHSSWGNDNVAEFYAGSLCRVAVYQAELSAARVLVHFEVGS